MDTHEGSRGEVTAQPTNEGEHVTKKVGPDQQEHLDALGAARDKMMRARDVEKKAMQHVHELVRQGFEKDISGVKLSRYSGLSQPRIYQIQREGAEPAGESDDQEAQVSEHETQATNA
jgi:hypothetical protein